MLSNYGARASAPDDQNSGETHELSGAAFLAWQRTYGGEPLSAAAAAPRTGDNDAQSVVEESKAAELVDAAMAIAWLDDAAEQYASVPAQPDHIDLPTDAGGVISRSAPPIRNDWAGGHNWAENQEQSERGKPPESLDHAWLSEKTLERVFSE